MDPVRTLCVESHGSAWEQADQGEGAEVLLRVLGVEGLAELGEAAAPEQILLFVLGEVFEHCAQGARVGDRLAQLGLDLGAGRQGDFADLVNGCFELLVGLVASVVHRGVVKVDD